MSWLENRSRAGRAAIAAAICLGLATPVVAGTLYSWRSDDGILSFTDEIKRIPARYRKAAKKQTLKTLGSYDRYTPADSTAEGSYAERLERRQAALQPTAPVVVVGGRATGQRAPLSVGVSGSRYGGSITIVPLDERGEAPTIIEHKRVKPAGSNATRHVKIVRSGERTILISEDEPSQQSYRGADFPAPAEDATLDR